MRFRRLTIHIHDGADCDVNTALLADYDQIPEFNSSNYAQTRLKTLEAVRIGICKCIKLPYSRARAGTVIRLSRADGKFTSGKLVVDAITVITLVHINYTVVPSLSAARRPGVMAEWRGYFAPRGWQRQSAVIKLITAVYINYAISRANSGRPIISAHLYALFPSSP